jgi:CheY-like chemotaxis protein
MIGESTRVLSSRTILLVDDDDDFRVAFADMLRLDGDRVIEAATGEAALVELDLLRRRRQPEPDLIVLDLMMPKMSGIEVLQRLHRSTRSAGVPVMIVTAVNDQMLRVRLDLPIAFKTDPEAVLGAVREQLARTTVSRMSDNV